MVDGKIGRRRRVPVLGRLRRRAGGPGQEDHQGHRRAAAHGRGELRRARPGRDLHRRPGPADGQRVRLLHAGPAERRDAERGGRRRRSWPSCPHCFNTIANEYPQLGGNYEVIHHTQLLARLVERGQAHPGQRRSRRRSPTTTRASSAGTTRSSPRRGRSWSRCPASRPQEMHRCKNRGFCCGAGGARMWMEERIGKRINTERIDEALGTDPDTISTGCPYCLVMLGDAVGGQEEPRRSQGHPRGRRRGPGPGPLGPAAHAARGRRRRPPPPAPAPADQPTG